MERLLKLLIASSLLLGAGCDRQAARQESRAAEAVAPLPPAAPQAASAFDRTVDERRLVVLCDPTRFRLSIRHRADQASLDESYEQRLVVDPQSLVENFPNHAGHDQYRASLIRYVRCGPLVVQLQGDFLNADVEGMMGAMPPFVAVRIIADNRTVMPDRAEAIRLTTCDENLPPWGDCAATYAVRIDLAYDPEARRIATREWVMSGSVVEEAYKTRERTGNVDIDLESWRARLR